MNISNKIGIYPGTFDPITFGHLDIIKRACKLVDKLIVSVAENVNKHTNFDASMAENEVKGLGINADIIYFNGLLMTFAKEQNASVTIRGLRAV